MAPRHSGETIIPVRPSGRSSMSSNPNDACTPAVAQTRVLRVGSHTMDAEPLTGGCLCGGVRFEITEPPVAALYCHCTRCQRRSGTAASANIRIAPDSLRITAGEELVTTYDAGGGAAKKAFCSVCGSALRVQHPETS